MNDKAIAELKAWSLEPGSDGEFDELSFEDYSKALWCIAWRRATKRQKEKDAEICRNLAEQDRWAIPEDCAQAIIDQD